MTETIVVQPKINLLTTEQISQVHEHSLKILSESGLQVDSERAIKLLTGHEGIKVSEGDRVTFEREVVEWAIQAAPTHIDIYNRRGEHAFRMGEDRTRFGIGCTTLNYLDPMTGETSTFARKHMQKMVRLGHALPNFDLVSTIGIIQDVDPKVADLYATLDMVSNTDKPLAILVSDEDLLLPTLDMLEHLTGDLAEKPYILPYFNPISPLVINQGTLDKMFASIERGLPFIYNSYGLAGITTPITPAGALAQLNAEILAGLTISQIIKEGTPISLGFLPAYLDMQNMVNFYDPSSYLLNIACSEMLAHYQIPHSGTSGGAMGWGPDFMASDSNWLNHLPSLMSKVALIGFTGNTMTAKVFSPVNVVFIHEIIKQALKFTGGFAFDEEAFGLAEIIERGPGGHFLSAPQTRKYVRTAYYTPDMYPRMTYEKWQELGRPEAMDLLKEYTRDLLETLTAPGDNQELTQKGEAFIQSLI